MLINLWYHLHYLCGKYLSFCGIKVQKDTTKRQVFSTTYLSPRVPPPSPWVKVIGNKKLLPICGTVIGNHTTIYSESEDFDSFHTTNLLQSETFCDENVKIYKVPLYSIAFPLLRWHDKLK